MLRTYFKLERDGYYCAVYAPATNKGATRIYDYIDDLVGTEEAINASSWCELAEIGERYEGDGFTITVVEE